MLLVCMRACLAYSAWTCTSFEVPPFAILQRGRSNHASRNKLQHRHFAKCTLYVMPRWQNSTWHHALVGMRPLPYQRPSGDLSTQNYTRTRCAPCRSFTCNSQRVRVNHAGCSPWLSSKRQSHRCLRKVPILHSLVLILIKSHDMVEAEGCWLSAHAER